MNRLKVDVWPPSQRLFITIFALHNLEEILSIRHTAFTRTRQAFRTRAAGAFLALTAARRILG